MHGLRPGVAFASRSVLSREIQSDADRHRPLGDQRRPAPCLVPDSAFAWPDGGRGRRHAGSSRSVADGPRRRPDGPRSLKPGTIRRRPPPPARASYDGHPPPGPFVADGLRAVPRTAARPPACRSWSTPRSATPTTSPSPGTGPTTALAERVGRCLPTPRGRARLDLTRFVAVVGEEDRLPTGLGRGECGVEPRLTGTAEYASLFVEAADADVRWMELARAGVRPDGPMRVNAPGTPAPRIGSTYPDVRVAFADGSWLRRLQRRHRPKTPGAPLTAWQAHGESTTDDL